MKASTLWIRPVAMVIVASVAFAGCAADRDTEDYCREQLGEELSEFNEVAATYRGIYAHRRDQTPVSTMELELVTDTRAGSRANCSQSVQVPVLRGAVYLNGVKGALMFRESSYDSELKTLKATVIVQTGSGLANNPNQQIEIDIAGTFIGSRFVGGMEAFGFPEHGGSFELVRNGALPDSSSLLNGKTSDPTVHPDPATFEGNILIKQHPDRTATSEKVRMIVTKPTRRTDQRAADLMIPVRWVQVSLLVGESNPIVFADSQWDQRPGFRTLNAITQAMGRDIQLTLDCEEVPVSGRQRTGMRCKYATNRGSGTTFEVAPIEESPQEKKE